MQIPNAHKAIISLPKLRHYLLNPAHRSGSPNGRLLLTLGYRATACRALDSDLRKYHLTAEVTTIKDNPFGRRFEIRARILPPCQTPVLFESIWQIDDGTDAPLFITMYPR